MKYKVIALHRAEEDVGHITRWIAERSLQGAEAWLDAYEQVLAHLAENADSLATAPESVDCNIPLKQALFKTAHGRTYRAVFTIAGNEVRILRVRGPGQPPLQDDELLPQ
jgi:plasmid stabilization system protein ParE